MEKKNIRNVPIAANVCEQVLREIEKQPDWSMAHIIMNPLAVSLIHKHKNMTEIYIITKGYGELGIGLPPPYGSYQQVTAGSVWEIPSNTSHILRNKSSGHLEHLVLAFPPFNPSDVYLKEERTLKETVYPLVMPEVQDCFDGAKILPYAFPHLDLSVAFGWVINDPARRKKPHYHNNVTEFVYVVEGEGFIEIDHAFHKIQSGDWIQIDPGSKHNMVNEKFEDLVVVCICHPEFRMEDIHY